MHEENEAIKCPECGARTAKLYKTKTLPTEAPPATSAVSVSARQSAAIWEILADAVKALRLLIDWLVGREERYLYCKSCGYLAKLT